MADPETVRRGVRGWASALAELAEEKATRTKSEAALAKRDADEAIAAEQAAKNAWGADPSSENKKEAFERAQERNARLRGLAERKEKEAESAQAEAEAALELSQDAKRALAQLGPTWGRESAWWP